MVGTLRRRQSGTSRRVEGTSSARTRGRTRRVRRASIAPTRTTGSITERPCTAWIAPRVRAVNRVGSESPKGDGMWAHSDLAGNVYEWTLDYHSLVYPISCNDCANLTPSTGRILRGGSFFV